MKEDILRLMEKKKINNLVDYYSILMDLVKKSTGIKLGLLYKSNKKETIIIRYKDQAIVRDKKVKDYFQSKSFASIVTMLQADYSYIVRKLQQKGAA